MNNILGYKFKDEKLVTRAFTHRSFSKDNYERLEFLGDSILDFVVAEYFYDKTNENEGNLTKLRASFVSESYLCTIFDKLKLQEKMIVGKSYKGNVSISIKADVIEAVIGAIYLDSNNINLVKKIIIRLLELNSYKNLISQDFKTQLQEYVQKLNKRVYYRLIKKSGESHNIKWTMGVFYDKKNIGEGEASSKNKAEQMAAHKALNILKGENND